MANVGQAYAPEVTSIASKVWKSLKSIMFVSVILGLLTLNVLTLLNDAIHTMGYNALKAVLTSALPKAMSTRVLRASPTSVRKSEVKAATSLLAKENAKLIAANSTLKKSYAGLEQSHIALKTKHTNLENLSRKRAMATRSFTEKLAKRTARNISINAASVGAEAIPFAGAAIVIGVTAMDIRDACETMKDLNTLNVSDFGQEGVNHHRVCGQELPKMEVIKAGLVKNWRSVYQTASNTLRETGDAMTPQEPHLPSWGNTKGVLCEMFSSIPGICSKSQL